jgi:hypothetical protein
VNPQGGSAQRARDIPATAAGDGGGRRRSRASAG